MKYQWMMSSKQTHHVADVTRGQQCKVINTVSVNCWCSARISLCCIRHIL